MNRNTQRLARAVAFAVAMASLATYAQQNRSRDDDDEQFDRQDLRDAYRRGYERGYDRGYRKGLEGDRRPPPSIPAPPPPPPTPVLGPIKVNSAFYGTAAKNCDATRYVARQSNGKRTHSFKVTNDMCGDPSRGDRKELQVTFWCGEVSRQASAREHQNISLSCF